MLHRTPDAGGLSNWVGHLVGGATRASVVTGFSQSPEFIASSDPEVHAGQVYRLYGATLNRAPDPAGFAAWVGSLDAGTALNTVAGGFVGSLEFTTAYGSLDNTQFVTLLYSNVLHRAPDPGGLAGWVAYLAGGATRTQVVTGFSESPEYIGGSAAAFHTFMGSVQPSWNDIIEGGAGNDSMSGGHGADTYVFRATEVGVDHVYQFESWDTVRMVGFGYANTAAAMSHMTASGNNVIFTDLGQTTTFHGATLTDMLTANWQFA